MIFRPQQEAVLMTTSVMSDLAMTNSMQLFRQLAVDVFLQKMIQRSSATSRYTPDIGNSREFAPLGRRVVG